LAMKLTVFRTIVLISSLLLTATAGLSQNDQKDKTSVEVRVNLGVLNGRGEPVEGISATDIKLYEDDGEQKITSLTKLGDALDITIVMDNTGSVRKQLDNMVGIAKSLVQALGHHDQAKIIRFVGRDNITFEQDWTSDKAKLDRALSNLFVEGGESAVVDAVYLSVKDIIERRSDKSGRRSAIVLVSDAEDRNSYYSVKDLIELLKDHPIPIFVVTLTKDLPEHLPAIFERDIPPAERRRNTVAMATVFANRVAAASGGTAYILKKGSTDEDLTYTLNTLTAELRAQYAITYTAFGVKKPTVRKLSATVADGPNGEKRKAIIKDAVVLMRD